MEKPQNVIGASNYDSSYNGGGFGVNNNYNENDLYEYENNNGSTGNNIISNASGKVKQFLSLKTDGLNNESHSQEQYGGGDFIDRLCFQINQTLIIPKAFYFFFFAAFGSLFPLMAIYFKQMAMSPVQVGILFGFRPFVEFLSAPFWANVGERLRKGKIVLIISLTCWIGFTLGVGFIKPPVHSCLMHNESHIFLEKYKKDQASSSSDTIVSGGYRVINKRSYDEYDFNDPYNTNKNDYYSNSNSDMIGSFMNIKKRQNEDQNRVKVINVTKIIKIKKTTTTTTTTKSNKKVKNKINNNYDELVFDSEVRTSSIPSTTFEMITTKYIKSKLMDAIDQARTKIMEMTLSQMKDNIENGQDELNKDLIDNAIDIQINDVNNKLLEENQEEDSVKTTTTTTRKIPKKIVVATSKTIPTTLTTQSLPQKQVEKTQYFDSSPLDSEKTRNKIIFLNDSALKLVKPSLQTSIVYHRDDVHRIFVIFLIFILAGEFFSAPAITLADSCTLQYLGPSRADLYGRQRMFGSLGWALAMFSVGILLDHSKAFTNHPCGKAGPDERNYSVCFAIYSVLMGCALIVATQFRFNYGDDEEIPLKSMKQTLKSGVNKLKSNKQFNPQQLINEYDPDEDSNSFQQQQQQQQSQTKSAYVEINVQSDESPKEKYLRLFQVCKTKKHASFLFIVWFMGIGVGIVFTFLFWHLQDLGGTPALYGIASVINHLSELMAYFFVHQIVRKYGHIKIFYAGLLGNGIRFIYVSILTEPYWILPFEFIQGLFLLKITFIISS
jgi:hypothetical protein